MVNYFSDVHNKLFNFVIITSNKMTKMRNIWTLEDKLLELNSLASCIDIIGLKLNPVVKHVLLEKDLK